MKKLLVVLLALVTVASFAAVNLSGSLSVTTEITYNASTSALSWSVAPSASWGASASGSDGTTGFTVSFGGSFTASSGYVWYKPYISDPLTVELRAGRLSRSLSIFGTTVINGVTANSLAAGFTMKSGDLSDTLWVYIDPVSAPNYVELDLVNRLTFGAIKVDALVNNIVANASSTPPSANLGLTVSIDAGNLLNLQAASLTVGGGFSGTFPSAPLSLWVVGASFKIDQFSGLIKFTNPAALYAELSTTLFAPVDAGLYISTDVTDPFNTLSLGVWASWKLGVLSNRISLDYASPNVTAAWIVSASF